MIRQMRWAAPLIGGALLLGLVAPLRAQTEKVYRQVAPEHVERVLSGMNIQFKKEKPAQHPKDWDFEFDRQNYKIRFTVGDGKLLWLSAYFPKCSLEKINMWNVNAKFSRAVLERVGDREYATIESQIDGGGGVTDNMVRQFITRFDNELISFDQFLRKD